MWGLSSLALAAFPFEQAWPCAILSGKRPPGPVNQTPFNVVGYFSELFGDLAADEVYENAIVFHPHSPSQRL